MSSNEAKENVATAQALSVGADPRSLEIAKKYLGTSKFIGYCQAFVRQVTGGRTSGASAIQAWNNAPQKIQGIQGMQPGDLVYFSPNSSNKGFGHTGIYAGNGQFVSATDKGIRSAGLGEWMNYTGQRLLGYVPGNNRTLGAEDQQGSQPNNLAYSPPTPEDAINHAVESRRAGLESQIPIPMPPTPDIMQQRRTNIDLNPGQNIAQNE